MIPWRTLVLVELRKATDTRAARWLFVVILGLGIAIALVTRGDTSGFAESITAPVLPLALVLPIVAVLAVTGEWTQRAAMTTFTLVPRRHRVLTARLTACIALVVATSLAMALLGAVTSLLFDPGALARADPSDVWVSLWRVTALAVCSALGGAAVGSLLLATPVAVAVTLLVPISYDIVVGIALPTVSPWISSLGYASWLTQPNWSWVTSSAGVPGLGEAASSFALWVAVPLGLGWWRQLRREVR